MAYKIMKQEYLNKHREKYFFTFSKETAQRFAKASGARTIYRLPNGGYIVRKTKRSPKTSPWWRK